MKAPKTCCPAPGGGCGGGCGGGAVAAATSGSSAQVSPICLFLYLNILPPSSPSSVCIYFLSFCIALLIARSLARSRTLSLSLSLSMSVCIPLSISLSLCMNIYYIYIASISSPLFKSPVWRLIVVCLKGSY